MTNPTNSADTIRSLEDRRWTAMLSADVATLDALTSPELIYTHSNARVDDKASWLDLMDGSDYRESRRSQTQVRMYESTAIVTGRAEIDLMVDQSPVGVTVRYSAIWVLVDGEWRFALWHATPTRD
ncbi:MAG: nuclear transport factor 2 family protein [Frankiales bacterium]|nr:nuclear transport factor 2 family protein [Frankiales bacterium]